MRCAASRLIRVRLLFLGLVLLGWVGCATSQTDPKKIAQRRAERAVAFASLTPSQQELVNRGQIQVGMPEDAVYIAWGRPAQVLQRGDASGESTTWLYTGSTTDEFINWNFVEARGRNGERYLDRVMTRDYAFQDYVSARLVFREGKVTQWEMLPAPSPRTIISPGGPVF